MTTRTRTQRDSSQERARIATAKTRLFMCLKVKDYPDCQAIIKECKCCVNMKDAHGNTPLYHAVKMGKVRLCEELLGQGADVNSQNEGANTALHIAMHNEQLELANILLQHGADIYALNHKRQTPLLLASGLLLKLLGLDSVPLVK